MNRVNAGSAARARMRRHRSPRQASRGRMHGCGACVARLHTPVNVYLAWPSASLLGRARNALDISDADRREDEQHVDDGLPHHPGLGVIGRRAVPRLPASMKVRSRWIEEMPMIAIASLIFSTLALTWLSHSGWSGWPCEIEARDEGLVAADDHHHQQVGDHHHVDQAEHASMICCSVKLVACEDRCHSSFRNRMT